MGTALFIVECTDDSLNPKQNPNARYSAYRAPERALESAYRHLAKGRLSQIDGRKRVTSWTTRFVYSRCLRSSGEGS